MVVVTIACTKPYQLSLASCNACKDLCASLVPTADSLAALFLLQLPCYLSLPWCAVQSLHTMQAHLMLMRLGQL